MADTDRQDRVLSNAAAIATEPDGAALLAALADFSLPPEQFGHRNHVHAAWQCLRAAPLPQATERFCSLLIRYVDHLGARDKYHHSLTVALLHLIAARMRDDQDWETFIAAHPELLHDARALLSQHYSPECLGSDAARLGFVAPDRAPLPRADH
ncbi:hypothetical protein E4T66_00380 [Sinimarinibacterium sp. CAU 1509]|uniref:hypothetical protein n=1 Tax=Sinimarinibacterium sp. CAU 1509 TaxID=2562283 RepID=UPI0010ACE72B|nr:hypothetical protein [Sinimarinibacterium sp. CAU 1509]TJY64741.1 hypothetical protein E4T66_00380 [Sinimarinibacterium sp. CAU 1509]